MQKYINIQLLTPILQLAVVKIESPYYYHCQTGPTRRLDKVFFLKKSRLFGWYVTLTSVLTACRSRRQNY